MLDTAEASRAVSEKRRIPAIVGMRPETVDGCAALSGRREPESWYA